MNNKKEVIVVNPSDKFDDNLGLHQDSMSLRGKFLASASPTSGSLLSFLALNPNALGGRAQAVAAIFANYRFKEVIIRIFTGAYGATNLSTSILTYGIMDDASGAEGDGPTTTQGVLELRTSGVIPANQSVFVRTWSQADPKAWFKTYAGASGSDPRLVYPGVLYLSTAGANQVVDIEIDYSISFKGAVDTAATIRALQAVKAQQETGWEQIPPGTGPPVRGPPPATSSVPQGTSEEGLKTTPRASMWYR